MSVTTTYLNDNDQTLLGRFVVSTLYNELCNKYGDKSNRWSLCLSVSHLIASTVKGETNTMVHRRSYWSQLVACVGEYFSKSTVAQTKSFYGWFVIPLARLNIVSLYTKFESSSFSHSWDMDGAPKIWNVSRDVITPLSGTVCHPSARTSYFDRVHMTSYSTFIEIIRVSCTVFEL